MGMLIPMIRKDLLRRVRAPLAVLVLLAFPVVFSLLLALTFGGGGSAPRVALLVENLDDGFLSGFLVSALGSEQTAEYFDVEPVGVEGLKRINKGEASALLRIPEGFTENLLSGEPITFELIRNPAQGILPEIAEQSMTVLTDLLSSASHVLRDPLDRLAEMTGGGDDPGASAVAGMSVEVYEILDRSSGLLMPPAITLESVQLGAAEEATDADSGMPGLQAIFLMVLPGISVWALFMVGDLGMRDILDESVKGTLRRQLSGPMTPAKLVLGKACSTAVLAALALIVLSLLGAIATRGAVSLPGFLLLSMALIVALTGLASVISGTASSQRQGGTVGAMLMLVFGFTGGSFIPLDSLPAFLRPIAPVSPFYWGTSGYIDLIADGAGVKEILPNAGILAGLGLLLLAIGSMLLTRRVARGALA